MKTVLSIVAVTLMSMSAASALNFSQAERAAGNDVPLASQYGNGFIEAHEAKAAGISSAAFNAADVNNDGKLTPTEFRNLG